jgi:hypothetical protein
MREAIRSIALPWRITAQSLPTDGSGVVFALLVPLEILEDLIASSLLEFFWLLSICTSLLL